MRRTIALSLLVGVGFTLTAACSSESSDASLAPKPFCEAVAKYEDTLIRTATQDKVKAAKQQRPALEKVLELAPEDIRPDIRTMADGYDQLIDGRKITPAESQDFAAVVARVERYGVTRCGLLKQKQSGGVV